MAGATPNPELPGGGSGLKDGVDSPKLIIRVESSVLKLRMYLEDISKIRVSFLYNILDDLMTQDGHWACTPGEMNAVMTLDKRVQAAEEMSSEEIRNELLKNVITSMIQFLNEYAGRR